MRTTSSAAAVIVLAVLLVAMAPPAAAQFTTVTSGQAYNFDQVNRGFFRIGGRLHWDGPFDLAHAKATIVAALSEDEHGQLIGGLPLTLNPRTSSARVAVFETPAGTTPFYRLTVRTCIPTLESCPNSRGLDVGDYEFLFEGVNVTIERPTCPDPPGPELTIITAFIILDDGVHTPIHIIVDDVWECFYRNDRVHLIRHRP